MIRKRIAEHLAKPETKALRQQVAQAQAANRARVMGGKIATVKALAATVQDRTAMNEVELYGEITPESAIEFRRRLAKCDQSKPLTIRIDSAGGVVMAGFGIVEAIKAWPQRTIGIVETNAQSMGSYIFAACDERLVTGHAMLMIHSPRVEGGGQLSPGDAKMVQSLETQMLQGYGQVIKGGAAKVVDMITKDENAWMTANQAIACGLATGHA